MDSLRRLWLPFALVLVLVLGAVEARAEQASSGERSFQAGTLDASAFNTCAVLDDGNVRCWDPGGFGRLGYANTTTIGDDETPGSVGPVSSSRARSRRAWRTWRSPSARAAPQRAWVVRSRSRSPRATPALTRSPPTRSTSSCPAGSSS